METARRFLVLTPVAFGASAVVASIYLVLGGTGLTPAEMGLAVLFVLAVAVAVLVVLLVADGLLRLVGVRNAWAALGLALVLVAVAYALRYVADAPWRSDGEEWGLLVLDGMVLASIPVWLSYVAGLVAGDLRSRRAREQTA
jgi:hypothetical protein